MGTRSTCVKSILLTFFLGFFLMGFAQAQTTTRVNVSSAGVQANGNARSLALSDNGRFVAFSSLADNLVADDTNGQRDVFVRDTLLQTTERASLSSSGAQSLNNASASDFRVAISANGRFVAYDSLASNLVAGDTNSAVDVFVRDRLTATTTRVSVRTNGQQGSGASFAPALSSDGRFVAFTSYADLGGQPTVLNVYVHDRLLQTTDFIGPTNPADGFWFGPDVSDDGRYVAFESIVPLVAADTNGLFDIYVFDRLTRTYTRESVASSGQQTLGSNIRSIMPSLTSDGRKLSFLSDALNLVANDDTSGDDVFLRDRSTGQTTRVSVSSTGERQLGGGFAQSLASNGDYVIWDSFATNLVAADTNNQSDYFVRDLVNGTTRRVNLSPGGTQSVSGNSARFLGVAPSGQLSVFTSPAPDLVPNDTNGLNDAFLSDSAPSGSIAQISSFSASPSTLNCRGQAVNVSWSSTGFVRCARPSGSCATTWSFANSELPTTGSRTELSCSNATLASSAQLALTCFTATGQSQTRTTTLEFQPGSCSASGMSAGSLSAPIALSNGALNYFVPVTNPQNHPIIAGLTSSSNGGDAILTATTNGLNITIPPNSLRTVASESIAILVGNGANAEAYQYTVALPPAEIFFANGFEALAR
jgi:WD40-like Beta Propeller Repeat